VCVCVCVCLCVCMCVCVKPSLERATLIVMAYCHDFMHIRCKIAKDPPCTIFINALWLKEIFFKVYCMYSGLNIPHRY
jgi:hypothetical protein